MEDVVITRGVLLNAWRDATRAAELADRLAKVALQAADQADEIAGASEEIAALAEGAARSAQHAAQMARQGGARARQLATDARGLRLVEADQAATATRANEEQAREQYYDLERESKNRHGDGEAPGS